VEPAGDQPALRTPGEYSSMSDIVLRQAETDAEVAACFPVMAQLRPHLASAEELVARVARQRETGYCILAAWCDGKPVALAGYRVQVNLIYGKFLYIDDLVTEADRRRSGLGARLLDALAIEAGKLGCERLVLDTALDNVLAHRFYYRQGLLACALRFRRPVAAA
jgi:ribosomal protein S18 acetylase RimI-like enzyme